jgi:hypothetical protein
MFIELCGNVESYSCSPITYLLPIVVYCLPEYCEFQVFDWNKNLISIALVVTSYNYRETEKHKAAFGGRIAMIWNVRFRNSELHWGLGAHSTPGCVQELQFFRWSLK